MNYTDDIQKTYLHLKSDFFRLITIAVILSNSLCFFILSYYYVSEERKNVTRESNIICNIIKTSPVISDSEISEFTNAGYSIFVIDYNLTSVVPFASKSPSFSNEDLFDSLRENTDLDMLGIAKYSGKHFFSFISTSNYNYIYILYPFSLLIPSIIRYLAILCGISLILIFVLSQVAKITIQKTLVPVSQARKSQDEFVRNASHELRTPLAIIQTGAAAMVSAKESEDDDTFYKHYNLVASECHRAASLISTMLLLAKSKNISPTSELKTSPDDIIIKCYERYNTICRQNNLTIELKAVDFNTADSDILINVNPEYPVQILSIFLDNAIAYSKKSTVFLGYTVEADNLIFFVKEDISSDNRQAHNDNIHLGIGMNIAGQLAELDNGKITLDEQRGSIITYSLKNS